MKVQFDKKTVFPIFALLLVAACSDKVAVPDTPAQVVYHIESDYGAAIVIENAYSSLPRCGKTKSPKLCSDVKIIKKLQQADDVAGDAILNAQLAVRTPGFGSDKIATAIASAAALTSEFVKFTTPLKVK